MKFGYVSFIKLNFLHCSITTPVSTGSLPSSGYCLLEISMYVLTLIKIQKCIYIYSYTFVQSVKTYSEILTPSSLGH